MDKQGFDQRYPAMFQPGGEGHASERHEPGQLLPPRGEPAPPIQPRPESIPVGARPQPVVAAAPEVAGDPMMADDEPKAPGPPAAREPHWGIRSWVLGLSVVGLTCAAAAFCLFAAVLIPAARSAGPSDFHGPLVVPWGMAILPGAPALFTAGLGMLAALFLAASRHYAKHAWWFHGAAAAVGLAALAGGAVALFGDVLFADLIYGPDMGQGSSSVPWYTVFMLSSWQLLLLGLVVLALVVIVRPGRKGAPGFPVAVAALWTGAVLACAGMWTWFAPQFFPLAQGHTITMSEGQSFVSSPWTFTVGQAGGPLLTVGAGALFWGLLILATTRRGPQEPLPGDPEMDAERAGKQGQAGGHAQRQL